MFGWSTKAARKLAVAFLFGTILSPTSSPFAQPTPVPAQRPATATTPTVPPPSPGTSALPAQAGAGRPVYEITGFRAARFGMTVPEVRAAIKADFAVADDAIRVAENQIERTTVLSISLQNLEPGPGPAQVSYIIGYTSKRLIQVNVLWAPAAADAARADRGRYLIAGVSLAQYFTSFAWDPARVVQGAILGANTVLLFAGEDSGTAATQVVADGVEFERQVNGRPEPSPRPTTPPTLQVSYIHNRTRPDVFRIERGRF